MCLKVSKVSMGRTSKTSWYSLLSDPNPKSVARDMKRSTLFRASQATIEQHQTELVAFIVIKGVAVASDFSGYLQRDFEYAEE